MEEQIRMMKKDRNRERAGHQRRAPNPKRQRLDKDGEKSPEAQIEKRDCIIPESEKRKLEEKDA